jgi:hypothetical protein
MQQQITLCQHQAGREETSVRPSVRPSIKFNKVSKVTQVSASQLLESCIADRAFLVSSFASFYFILVFCQLCVISPPLQVAPL